MAVADVTIWCDGRGDFTINGKPMVDYLINLSDR